MKMQSSTSLEEFYDEAARFTGKTLQELIPSDIKQDVGHFNIFDIRDTIIKVKATNVMPYNRRAYYKISLIRGKNRAEYADKVIDITNNALLFATPKVPYHWYPLAENQAGSFCVFTDSFLLKNKSGIELEALPIFQSGAIPVFEISKAQANEIQLIFDKMRIEIASDYPFKYDLIRNYLMELIHYGQKLQPNISTISPNNASERITAIFMELLERQFPIDFAHQQLNLKTPKDYADRLSVHVNHLNKVLKENTGKTTSELISNRITQEAKILLKQTDWNISEIAFSLGFEEVAHFSNFFKKQTNSSPLQFR